jgi:hypothetical protein
VLNDNNEKPMRINQEYYLCILEEMVYNRISDDINERTFERITQEDLIESHLKNKGSKGFQQYYFSILENDKLFLESTNFFSQFIKQYKLQGIDKDCLSRFEAYKETILKNIQADKLCELYFESFSKVSIKYGGEFREKDLNSFFVKLVHTFKPRKYCALDNPIKNYFGLKNESFFIAFHIISSAYKGWATENHKLIESIRQEFKKADIDEALEHERITDMKLMDLIYWSKANRIR